MGILADEPKPLDRGAGHACLAYSQLRLETVKSTSCLCKARVISQGLRATAETVLRRNVVGCWRLRESVLNSV
ncbi:hypothetical protein KEJ51_02780 [Candidatus Bathyarchaeota archaeon]|nr:hypothetical protein [Candidatus Bathyarchaeota archaeon]